jgi:hypothetical protein
MLCSKRFSSKSLSFVIANLEDISLGDRVDLTLSDHRDTCVCYLVRVVTFLHSIRSEAMLSRRGTA